MTDDRRLKEWADELPERYLECRDFGHAWKPWAVRVDNELNSYERTLRCTRCRGERHEALGLSGAKSSRGYTYPEGYLTPAGTGRLYTDDKDTIRLTHVLRQLNDPRLLTRGRTDAIKRGKVA